MAKVNCEVLYYSGFDTEQPVRAATYSCADNWQAISQVAASVSHERAQCGYRGFTLRVMKLEG